MNESEINLTLHESPPAGMEVLSHSECLRRLSEADVGRIAFVAEGRPTVLPVNFVMCGDDVAFRTDPGGKLEAAQTSSAVAFEVDDLDYISETGWSVVVQGVAEEVTRPAELEELEGLPLLPWAQGPKAHWVRVHPFSMTGVRMARAERDPEQRFSRAPERPS